MITAGSCLGLFCTMIEGDSCILVSAMGARAELE